MALGDVDPGEQRGVVGDVGAAVGAGCRGRGRGCLRTRSMAWSASSAAAVGGQRDEAGGAAQAAVHVGAEARVVPDARRARWVQHLQQQPGHAADHHAGDVAVHAPGDGGGAEQAVGAAGDGFFAAAAVVEDGGDFGRDGVLERTQHVRAEAWRGAGLRIRHRRYRTLVISEDMGAVGDGTGSRGTRDTLARRSALIYPHGPDLLRRETVIFGDFHGEPRPLSTYRSRQRAGCRGAASCGLLAAGLTAPAATQLLAFGRGACAAAGERLQADQAGRRRHAEGAVVAGADAAEPAFRDWHQGPGRVADLLRAAGELDRDGDLVAVLAAELPSRTMAGSRRTASR